MASTLPQARIYRKGGVAVAPPRVPLRERLASFELGPRTRGFLAAFFGLWPITAVVLLGFGLAYLNMMYSSP